MAKKTFSGKDKSINERIADGTVKPLNDEGVHDPEPKVNGADPGFSVRPRGEAKETSSISVRLGADGTIDGSMTEKTWGKLRSAIASTPGAREKLIGGEAGSGGGLIGAAQVEPFYTGIGLINLLLATRVLKIDPAIATAIVPYSREELQALSEATADAINENLGKMPAWLLDILRGGGSVALVKLAMVFFSVHHNKFQALRRAVGTESGTQPSVN